MNDYPSGTVAIATVRGIEGVRVMRGASVLTHAPMWLLSVNDSGQGYAHDDEVTDVRPLVVLDLAGEPFAVDWLRAQAVATNREFGPDQPLAKMFRNFADQIDAQTKPPRIPEPGLWGVVEAGARSTLNRFEYVRASDGYWYALRGAQRSWGELIDPTLIREGVES